MSRTTSSPHFIGLALAALFFVAHSAWADDAAAYKQTQDVVYGEVHGTGLLMDIFQPMGKSNGLAIVDVVSGAWYSDRNKIRDHIMAQFYDVFCSRGYVVFAARPGSKTRYTAAEMDQHIKMAIRFVKEHAADYKIDPNRLGITGASAGGHLATLAALTASPAKPDAKKAIERHDTNIAALAVFFPPTDFLDWRDGKMIDISVVAPLLFVGGSQTHSEEEIRTAAKAVSPLHQITTVSFPTLLIHGDADQVVPLSHSQKLAEALKKAGGDVELIVKAGGGHPWLTIPEEVRVMADWFDKKLQKPK